MKTSETAEHSVTASPRVVGGGRVDWAARNLPNDQPLITIITSTFNAAADLPWTIKSVRKQTYKNVQWIVADGGSKDGTVELLRRNEDIVDVWFSEPDTGIYDAWNKALQYACGEWVQFIGAGDELASPETLSQIVPTLTTAHPEHDLVYGRLQHLREGTREPLDEVGQPWDEMKGKWQFFGPKLPVHPEVFHHRSVVSGFNTFDTRFKIAADSYFLMKCIRKKDPLYVPILVDKMPTGGVSEKLENVALVAAEVRLAAKELGFKLPFFYACKELLRLYIKRVLLLFLPSSMVYRIANIYRKARGKPLRRK